MAVVEAEIPIPTRLSELESELDRLDRILRKILDKADKDRIMSGTLWRHLYSGTASICRMANRPN